MGKKGKKGKKTAKQKEDDALDDIFAEMKALDIISVNAATITKNNNTSTRTSTNNNTKWDVETLVEEVLREFVFGEDAYPVKNSLDQIQSSGDLDVLVPGRACRRDVVWLPEHERFYSKMFVSGRCSELVFTLAELLNGLPVACLLFRGQSVESVELCTGFVTHGYRRLSLKGNFGKNSWQHSTGVNNHARNHIWMQIFLKEGKETVAIDPTGLQFDLCSTSGPLFFNVTPLPDPCYEPCYTIPLRQAPIAFVNWCATNNNASFEGAHVVEQVRRLRRKLSVPVVASALSICSPHKAMFREANRRQLPPGEMCKLVHTMPQVLKLQKEVNLTLDSLKLLEDVAVQKMYSIQKEGPPQRIACI